MVSPRRLPLGELVAVLVSEHAKIVGGLARARDDILAGDPVGARKELTEVVCTFKQHIADEEGQILSLLLDAYGKEGSEDAVRVFQQHRPIYALLRAVDAFSQLPTEKLSTSGAELARLLDDHTRAEEERVFPRALEARRRAQASLDRGASTEAASGVGGADPCRKGGNRGSGRE
jgi:hypothetical protein